MFLPRSTSHLTALRILDARLNCLRSLPEDLENLINLETLNVSQNFQYLDSLPYSVGFLLSLVELDVSYNKIRALPDSIGCLKKLQKISVEGNPLSSPPPELVEQGLHAVKEYLCQKMNAGHQSPTTNNKKSKSWVGRLVRYGTFNGIGQSRAAGAREEREAFIVPDYRPIDGLASPRYMGMFSPRRLFSPRTYFTNWPSSTSCYNYVGWTRKWWSASSWDLVSPLCFMDEQGLLDSTNKKKKRKRKIPIIIWLCYQWYFNKLHSRCCGDCLKCVLFIGSTLSKWISWSIHNNKANKIFTNEWWYIYVDTFKYYILYIYNFFLFFSFYHILTSVILTLLFLGTIKCPLINFLYEYILFYLEENVHTCI